MPPPLGDKKDQRHFRDKRERGEGTNGEVGGGWGEVALHQNAARFTIVATTGKRRSNVLSSVSRVIGSCFDYTKPTMSRSRRRGEITGRLYFFLPPCGTPTQEREHAGSQAKHFVELQDAENFSTRHQEPQHVELLGVFARLANVYTQHNEPQFTFLSPP